MIELKIEGATCNGCVKSIEKALTQVKGVEGVSFSLETKLAQITGNADKEALTEAVEMAGFDVIES
ncbi:heavy-metal-associated domain-containing protein [Reinekea marinisedimentorum]|uniref:Copper chaperone n=1 Tax=Reinekea marinisedimentorum TaxID=230495 RepID=A0A4R3HXW0_9GAMM|nr:heavy metal-associated domain-containing protein [Reinekea marinisedimentorum]TCS37121.1 copper chaperone [Reinekea marinisedimentorum]